MANIDYMEPKRKNSRKKGNNFELEIAKLLNETFETTDFCRSPGSGAFSTTHKLPEWVNIYGDLITPAWFSYIVECKKGYPKIGLEDLLKPSSPIYSFIKQAQNDASKAHKYPLLIYKKDRGKELAFLRNSKLFQGLWEHLKFPYVTLLDESFIMCYLRDLLKFPKNFFSE